MSDDDRLLSVLRLITEERERQVRIGYTHEIDTVRPREWWVQALQVELGELAAVSMVADKAKGQFLSVQGRRHLRLALVKIAAVCVAALEAGGEGTV